MKLERINIANIFPNENNPRNNFAGIEELANTFENGEPYTPITVRKEGGIYTLIDGERRYRAMTKLGTKTCNALIAETQDDADALLAMVATNNKQALTPIELSAGIQQSLLFADVERVEKASGKKNLRKVKRAMQRVQDACEDMSIERLIAIEDNSNNIELVEALKTCTESEWRKVIKDFTSDSKPTDQAQKQTEEEQLREELEKALSNVRVLLSALKSKKYALDQQEAYLLQVLDKREQRKEIPW